MSNQYLTYDQAFKALREGKKIVAPSFWHGEDLELYYKDGKFISNKILPDNNLLLRSFIDGSKWKLYNEKIVLSWDERKPQRLYVSETTPRVFWRYTIEILKNCCTLIYHKGLLCDINDEFIGFFNTFTEAKHKANKHANGVLR